MCTLELILGISDVVFTCVGHYVYRGELFTCVYVN